MAAAAIVNYAGRQEKSAATRSTAGARQWREICLEIRLEREQPNRKNPFATAVHRRRDADPSVLVRLVGRGGPAPTRPHSPRPDWPTRFNDVVADQWAERLPVRASTFDAPLAKWIRVAFAITMAD